MRLASGTVLVDEIERQFPEDEAAPRLLGVIAGKEALLAWVSAIFRPWRVD